MADSPEDPGIDGYIENNILLKEPKNFLDKINEYKITVPNDRIFITHIRELFAQIERALDGKIVIEECEQLINFPIKCLKNIKKSYQAVVVWAERQKKEKPREDAYYEIEQKLIENKVNISRIFVIPKAKIITDDEYQRRKTEVLKQF